VRGGEQCLQRGEQRVRGDEQRLQRGKHGVHGSQQPLRAGSQREPWGEQRVQGGCAREPAVSRALQVLSRGFIVCSRVSEPCRREEIVTAPTRLQPPVTPRIDARPAARSGFLTSALTKNLGESVNR
jgi:hypothetical protein